MPAESTGTITVIVSNPTQNASIRARQISSDNSEWITIAPGESAKMLVNEITRIEIKQGARTDA